METKIKASYEFNNYEFNAEALKYGFDRCAREIARVYIEDYHSQKNVSLRDFANHIKDDVIYVVYDTTNSICPFTDETSIYIWKGLKERGRSKIFATYQF